MKRRTFLKLMSLSAAGMFLHGVPSRAQFPFRIYMTFDDGPTTEPNGTGDTHEVLDILAQYDARATFFLHGRSINDWEGGVIARMINEGHAVGNHLWRQGGNTVEDGSSLPLLAQQFIQAEARIRQVLQAADPAAYARYLRQPRLFRRPGGNNGLTGFLDLENYPVLETAPYLANYRRLLPWLKGVYDYSGWHVNNGDSITIKGLVPYDAETLTTFVLSGSGNFYGVDDYLCADGKRALEVRDGLIVLMHDAAPVTRAGLPKVITALRERGASFHPLPRPIDRPNAATVGIGYAPTPDSSGLACKVPS
ncbi:MAG: hypothetical protein OHK0023_19740 [Anaerolineae bacterium]